MNRKRQSVNAVIRNRTLDTKYLKLKDVARFSSAKTTDICLESYISTENMIPFLGGVSTASSVPDVKSASFYEEGDILLSNIRLYFCKIWKADKKGACSNDVLVVKPKNNIDPTFLYYCLCDKNFFNYADLTSKGTKMPRGTKSAIMKYLVPNIPLCTQNIIASILSNYDKLIQNYKKQIEDLQNLAGELYKEWFVRFRFPGHEKASFENGIPAGWKVDKIKNRVKRLSFGKTYKKDEVLTDGEIIVIDQSESEYLGYHNGEPSHKATIDEPIALFGDHSCKYELMTMDFSLGENVIPFVSQNIDVYYLYYAVYKIVETEEYKRHWSLFINKKILIPEEKLQLMFRKYALSIKKQTEILSFQITNLSKQRDLLLPRLMSGKLEVK